MYTFIINPTVSTPLHCDLFSPQRANFRTTTDTFPQPKQQNEINLKVKVTLEQAMKAQRGSRGIPLLFS